MNMKEYIDHMKEGQNGTYYITDENIAVGSSSRVIKKNLVKQSRNVRRNCREEGRLQEVLQTVWQALKTWHP